MNNIRTIYSCYTYEADGQTGKSREDYMTAKQAMKKADIWRKNGVKANVYKVIIDSTNYTTRHIALD